MHRHKTFSEHTHTHTQKIYCPVYIIFHILLYTGWPEELANSQVILCMFIKNRILEYYGTDQYPEVIQPKCPTLHEEKLTPSVALCLAWSSQRISDWSRVRTV